MKAVRIGLKKLIILSIICHIFIFIQSCNNGCSKNKIKRRNKVHKVEKAEKVHKVEKVEKVSSVKTLDPVTTNVPKSKEYGTLKVNHETMLKYANGGGLKRGTNVPKSKLHKEHHSLGGVIRSRPTNTVHKAVYKKLK